MYPSHKPGDVIATSSIYMKDRSVKILLFILPQTVLTVFSSPSLSLPSEGKG